MGVGRNLFGWLGFFRGARATTAAAAPPAAMLSTHKFLHLRIVLLGVPVTDQSATDVIDALASLDRGSEPITLCINCPGGSVAAGERIIAAVAGTRCEVHTLCAGVAGGTAAEILLCGRRRFAVPSATVVFVPIDANGTPNDAVIPELETRSVRRIAATLNLNEGSVRPWMGSQRAVRGAELKRLGIVHEFVRSPALA